MTNHPVHTCAVSALRAYVLKVASERPIHTQREREREGEKKTSTMKCLFYINNSIDFPDARTMQIAKSLLKQIFSLDIITRRRNERRLNEK